MPTLPSQRKEKKKKEREGKKKKREKKKKKKAEMQYGEIVRGINDCTTVPCLTKSHKGNN